MKTAKQIAESRNIPVRLVRSVIRQTGRDNLPDIARHGIDGGFCGFTYYTDTDAFFHRNRREIVELLESMADDLGEEPIQMVAGFRCLEDTKETRASIARCLYGGRLTDDDVTVTNALAWFAGEEVARALDDMSN